MAAAAMEAEEQCYVDEFEEFRARAFSGGSLPQPVSRKGSGLSGRGPRQISGSPPDPTEDGQLVDLEVDRTTSITGPTPTICCQACGISPHSSPPLRLTDHVSRTRSTSLSPSPKTESAHHQRHRLSEGNCGNCQRQRAQSRSPSPMCRSVSPKPLHGQRLGSQIQANMKDMPTSALEHASLSRPHTDNLAEDKPRYLTVESRLEDRVLSHMTWVMLEDDEWILGDMRPRISSMPSGPFRQTRSGRHLTPTLAQLRRSPIPGEAHRVKSYTITSKGVVNKGAVFLGRGSTTSVASNESDSTTHSATSVDQPVYRVMVIGEPGVGKRALVQSLILPDTPDKNFSSFDDEDVERTVSILLDGEESTLDFIDITKHQICGWTASGDAYMVVYSVEDRQSFEAAVDRLYELRKAIDHPVAIILVANKADLVRIRVVFEHEGRVAASSYDCKYIEVSAAIDHKIDDLLVGILKQIRLMRQSADKPSKPRSRSRATHVDDTCCRTLLKAHQNVFVRLFRGDKPTSRSCENLYEL